MNSIESKNIFFICSETFRKSAFGHLHPLSGKRVSAVVDLCIAMGWLTQSAIHISEPASFETLKKFHDPDYIKAIIRADESGVVTKDMREKYALGTMENPLFKGLYERAATTVGGSILAAQKIMTGGVAYHPSGGTHHGKPDRASGFCYFNDPVFAISEFIEQGLDRVAYVDLDAHHGDGVQDAFASDTRVWTFSIHEEKRWPHSGPFDDHGGGRSFNMPVPQGLNDSEFCYLLDNGIYPELKAINPQAIVITLGADGLSADPLSKMDLSNSVLWDAVTNLISLSPRTVILGGGGYNPWTTIRCWAGLWGSLIGADVAIPFNDKARAIMSELESDLIDEEDIVDLWLTHMVDVRRSEAIRSDILELVNHVYLDSSG